MNTIEKAKNRILDSVIKYVCESEAVDKEELFSSIARGKVVIPKNKKRNFKNVCGIGKGLRTKINTNIGTSQDFSCIELELKKVEVAKRFGSDTIMDLSTSYDLKKVRKKMLEKSNMPVGTVPAYEVAVLGSKKYGDIGNIPEDFFIKTVEEHAKDGIDFFTIHAGINRKTLELLSKSNRIMGMVSRGGAIILEWMTKTSRENPFFNNFDEIVDIAKMYDVTISLGDGLRPGAICDATDLAQIGELIVLGELQRRAFGKEVQVMIEGPGHVPINEIKTNVELEKFICNEAPFYVLGPIVSDVAPGYDHITSAIGGALAAFYGADFLCYVTPAEHLRLPTLNDVREGVIATKIAAHAADVAKGIRSAEKIDAEVSRARFKRNWERQFRLSIDPEKCRLYRKSSKPKMKDVCTMCSEYCAIKISQKALGTP